MFDGSLGRLMLIIEGITFMDMDDLQKGINN